MSAPAVLRCAFFWVLIGLAGLSGCAVAQAPNTAASEGELPVLVRLAPSMNDSGLDTWLKRASTVSGVPVRYRAATGGRWHAVALSCADPPASEAAYQRLTADTAHFDAVQRDGRRQVRTP